MKEKGLDDSLNEIVHQYGIARVDQALREIRKSTRNQTNQRKPSASDSKRRCERRAEKRPRKRATATGFVSNLEESAEVGKLLNELAIRFDKKEFLPNFGEIRNFCEIHGIDTPVSKSREAAVPRVFKHLSQVDIQDLQFMIQAKSFSGPTRLGPIAEAIKRSSKFS